MARQGGGSGAGGAGYGEARVLALSTLALWPRLRAVVPPVLLHPPTSFMCAARFDLQAGKTPLSGVGAAPFPDVLSFLSIRDLFEFQFSATRTRRSCVEMWKCGKSALLRCPLQPVAQGCARAAQGSLAISRQLAT